MKIIVVSICLVFLLGACTSPEQQAANTATALTATAAAWTPTSTATNTPTYTPSPTPTDTPTPTLTPTATETPVPTPDPNRYYASDGSFSMMKPEGWTERDFGLTYKGLAGPVVGTGQVNIVFSSEEYKDTLASYSAALQEFVKTMDPNLNVASEESLITPGGLDYVRLVLDYTLNEAPIRQIAYIFENGDLKYTAIFSRPQDMGAEFDAIVDEAIKTFTFGP